MTLTFSGEAKKRMLASIQAHCAEHLDVDIGILQAERLFELMVGLVAASAYNHAIGDAQAYLQGKLLDLEADLHEPVAYEPPGASGG